MVAAGDELQELLVDGDSLVLSKCLLLFSLNHRFANLFLEKVGLNGVDHL